MVRFPPTPAIPSAGVDAWLATALGALKENMDLVTGTGRERDGQSRGIFRGDITAAPLGAQVMGSVTLVSPDGYTHSGDAVADLAAFRALRDDVQALANDLYYTRSALDLLIKNFTG
jgi:hypothetical protein